MTFDSFVTKLWRRKCGSTPSEAQVIAAEAHFQEHKLTPETFYGGRPAVINVYFHHIVKAKSEDPAVGYILYKPPSCFGRRGR